MEFSYCWNCFVPFLQPHKMISEEPACLSSTKPQASQPAQREQDNDSLVNQGSRSWEIWPVPMVYHSGPATPCSPTRFFRGMSGCLVSSESLSFHLSAFQHCLSKAINLPAPHWVVRLSSLLFGKWFENKPPFLQKVPISSHLKQLQPAWDFSVHGRSTCWASCFSPGFRKVRTAVYWISKHTDHTALLAH